MNKEERGREREKERERRDRKREREREMTPPVCLKPPLSFPLKVWGIMAFIFFFLNF